MYDQNEVIIMKNVAIVFAGGVGTRMNSKAKPKQFLEIHGKPIIIHTLEHFENHPMIDSICVVSVSEWIGYVEKLLSKFGIRKVKWLVQGGETALDSQLNGLRAIDEEDAIVLIHDGVRPLINEQVITDCINCVKKYGNAITVAPATETIIRQDNESRITSTISRSECMLARAPQCFMLKDILSIHEKSIREGKHKYIDSTSLMLDYGKTLHTVEGNVENIKVTTPADFYICRALLDARESSQIYGL